MVEFNNVNKNLKKININNKFKILDINNYEKELKFNEQDFLSFYNKNKDFSNYLNYNQLQDSYSNQLK